MEREDLVTEVEAREAEREEEENIRILLLAQVSNARKLLQKHNLKY